MQRGNFSIYNAYNLVMQASQGNHCLHWLWVASRNQYVMVVASNSSKNLWFVLKKCFKHFVMVVYAKQPYSLMASIVMPYVNIHKATIHIWIEEMLKCPHASLHCTKQYSKSSKCMICVLQCVKTQLQRNKKTWREA
jgi:hypothetical protein